MAATRKFRSTSGVPKDQDQPPRYVFLSLTGNRPTPSIARVIEALAGLWCVRLEPPAQVGYYLLRSPHLLRCTLLVSPSRAVSVQCSVYRSTRSLLEIMSSSRTLQDPPRIRSAATALGVALAQFEKYTLVGGGARVMLGAI